jgi:large subunit ribosomal protein L18
MKSVKTTSSRDRRRAKIRAKISGTADKPRLSVFKSNTRMYAQLIDDESQTTLASAYGTNATEVGEKIAKAAMSKSIDKVVFDRGGYIYTGKTKALADSARQAGLKF